MSQNSPPPAAGPPLRFPAAPPDGQVIAVGAIFALTLLWFGGQTTLSILAGARPDQFNLAATVFIVGAILWRWLNSVRGYMLRPDAPDGPQLQIRQVAPWRTVAVPLTRLRKIDAAPPVRSIFNTSILSMGSLFGWAGNATVPDLGNVLAYATNARRAVLLELAPRAEARYATSDGVEARGPVVLISPRDPQALAAALQPFCTPTRGPGLFGTATPATPPRPQPARKRRR